MDLEGRERPALTLTGNWNDEAAFSPDGGRIAFACRNEGDFQICVLDIGSGRTVQISDGARRQREPDLVARRDAGRVGAHAGSSTQIAVRERDGSGMRSPDVGREQFLSGVAAETLE